MVGIGGIAAAIQNTGNNNQIAEQQLVTTSNQAGSSNKLTLQNLASATNTANHLTNAAYNQSSVTTVPKGLVQELKKFWEAQRQPNLQPAFAKATNVVSLTDTWRPSVLPIINDVDNAQAKNLNVENLEDTLLVTIDSHNKQITEPAARAVELRKKPSQSQFERSSVDPNKRHAIKEPITELNQAQDVREQSGSSITIELNSVPRQPEISFTANDETQQADIKLATSEKEKTNQKTLSDLENLINDIKEKKVKPKEDAVLRGVSRDLSKLLRKDRVFICNEKSLTTLEAHKKIHMRENRDNKKTRIIIYSYIDPNTGTSEIRCLKNSGKKMGNSITLTPKNATPDTLSKEMLKLITLMATSDAPHHDTRWYSTIGDNINYLDEFPLP